MGNLWLGSLGREDLERLEPHSRPVIYRQGDILLRAGARVDTIWFPTSGVISLMTAVDADRSVETAVVGREGVIGVTAGPLDSLALSTAVAHTGGGALTLPAEALRQALDQSAPLRFALSRYAAALMAQVQQTAACNSQHRLEERLAAWLLNFQDRIEGQACTVTQADIADLLGVRRATVSEVSAALEHRGLIRRGRGVIEVVSRSGLEAATCGCYAAIRKTTHALMPSTKAPSAS